MRASTGPGILVPPLPQRAPYWVRLVRKGGELIAYSSADGGTFTEFGWRPDGLNVPYYVGFAVCSNNSGASANTATLDNVTLNNMP